MDKWHGERSDATIFGYEDNESKKQDTDWDLQEFKFEGLTYSSYNLYQPRNEQIGILKQCYKEPTTYVTRVKRGRKK